LIDSINEVLTVIMPHAFITSETSMKFMPIYEYFIVDDGYCKYCVHNDRSLLPRTKSLKYYFCTFRH